MKEPAAHGTAFSVQPFPGCACAASVRTEPVEVITRTGLARLRQAQPERSFVERTRFNKCHSGSTQDDKASGWHGRQVRGGRCGLLRCACGTLRGTAMTSCPQALITLKQRSIFPESPRCPAAPGHYLRERCGPGPGCRRDPISTARAPRSARPARWSCPFPSSVKTVRTSR